MNMITKIVAAYSKVFASIYSLGLYDKEFQGYIKGQLPTEISDSRGGEYEDGSFL